MEMTCLAQVSGALAHISTACICSRATRAPRYPRSSSRAARRGKSSKISKHDWTLLRRAQDNKQENSRTYARQLRPSLEMRVGPPMPPPDVLRCGCRLPSRSARFTRQDVETPAQSLG